MRVEMLVMDTEMTRRHRRRSERWTVKYIKRETDIKRKRDTQEETRAAESRTDKQRDRNSETDKEERTDR